jgi:hypothetical protein
MSNLVPVKLIYLTAAIETGRPILNVEAAHSEHAWRFELTHQQLLDLNNQTADALLPASPERSEGGKGKT